MTTYENILVEIDDLGVATLTLNRPDSLNAFDLTMDKEFHDAMWELDADEAVRAIVVTGAGRGFSAGIDLSGGAGAFGEEFQQEHDETLGVNAETVPARSAFWRMDTPIIGAINGSAVGAGLTIAMLFDLRIVAEEAKLGFVFTPRGILPDANITWLLPRIVGVQRALELLMTGRIFKGAEAVAMGLAIEVLPADEVLSRARELARSIAKTAAPASVAITKRLVQKFLGETDRVAAFALETDLIWWAGTQPDAVEGVMSFLEKRDPDWKMSKHPDLPENLKLDD